MTRRPSVSPSTLRQHTKPTPGQDEKVPFLIPVAMALLDEAGRRTA